MITDANQTNLFIDLKHTVIEKSFSDKKQVFVKFLTCLLQDLSFTKSLPSHTSNLLLAYTPDYIDFLFQKRSQLALLQSSCLQNILQDFLARSIDISPEELKQNDFEDIINRHIHILKELYTIQKDVKQHLKSLFEDPSLDMKFFYHTKYPFKRQIIKNLIETELTDVVGYYSFDNLQNDSAYVVTIQPSTLENLKNPQLIYFSSSKINIFRKLQLEEKLTIYPQKAEISCLSQLPSTITFLRESTSQGDLKRIRIGYAFDDLKFKKLQGRGDVVSSKYPIEMIPIDLRMSLDRKIDGFLHRVFGLTKDEKDPFSSVIMQNFQKMNAQQNLHIFDPMDSLDIIQSREAFQRKIKEIFQSKKFLEALNEFSSSKFSVPKACHIDPKALNPDKVISFIKSQNMKFPLVVKTTDACLDQSCHQMSVVLNEEGLLEIESSEKFRNKSHILQEYINHDERIYKVYMIGDHLAIQQKQSLPNLSDKLTSQNYLNFHSQASFKDLPEFQQFIKGFEPSEIDVQVVKTMCKELGEELKLSIVGLDLIKETGTDIHYLIDINYFPGFKGFKDLRSVLHSHFYAKCCSK